MDFPGLTDSSSLAPSRAPPGLVPAIDDERYLGALMEAYLRRRGISAVSASTEQEALRLWSQHKHQIGAVLMDTTFVTEKRLAEISRLLESERPRVRIIYM